MKTAKVKIMICIDKNGDWNASGWGGTNGPTEKETKYATDIAQEPIVDKGNICKLYTIVTEVPIPEFSDVPEIEGKIEE